MKGEQVVGTFDIERDALLAAGGGVLERRVRAELGRLVREVARCFRDPSVLLTGSLAFGEGRCRRANGRWGLASDFDLVVVAPQLGDCLRALGGERMQAAVKRAAVSAPVEITVIWEPLLTLGLTTTAAARVVWGRSGVAWAGSGKVQPPRAANALANGYRFLAQVPLAGAHRPVLAAKALSRGAQALLLQRFGKANSKRALCCADLKNCYGQIGSCRDSLGPDDVKRIRWALEQVLGSSSAWPAAAFEWNDYRQVFRLMETIRSRVDLGTSWKDILKHAFWAARARRAIVPSSRSTALAVRGLSRLAAAWDEGGFLDEERLGEARSSFQRLCGLGTVPPAAPAIDQYRLMWRGFADFVRFYPHKVFVGDLDPGSGRF